MTRAETTVQAWGIILPIYFVLVTIAWVWMRKTKGPQGLGEAIADYVVCMALMGMSLIPAIFILFTASKELIHGIPQEPTPEPPKPMTFDEVGTARLEKWIDKQRKGLLHESDWVPGRIPDEGSEEGTP